MRVLLDTHYLIWLANDPSMLSRREQDVIGDERYRLLASTVSLWELRTKWNARDRNGNRKGVLSPQAAFDFVESFGLELAPVLADDCLYDLEPAMAHADPFDEMLLIHAGRLEARLLTRDRALANHPLAYRFE